MLRRRERDRLAGIERDDGIRQGERCRRIRRGKSVHADAPLGDQDRQIVVGREFQGKGRAHRPDCHAPHPHDKRSMGVLRHFEVGGALEKRNGSFPAAEVRRDPGIAPEFHDGAIRQDFLSRTGHDQSGTRPPGIAFGHRPLRLPDPPRHAEQRRGPSTGQRLAPTPLSTTGAFIEARHHLVRHSGLPSPIAINPVSIRLRQGPGMLRIGGQPGLELGFLRIRHALNEALRPACSHGSDFAREICAVIRHGQEPR